MRYKKNINKNLFDETALDAVNDNKYEKVKQKLIGLLVENGAKSAEDLMMVVGESRVLVQLT